MIIKKEYAILFFLFAAVVGVVCAVIVINMPIDVEKVCEPILNETLKHCVCNFPK